MEVGSGAPTGAELGKVATWLEEAERIVALTGAGFSTESGIPDFRSPGGIWDRYRPVEYGEFLTSHQARVAYWVRSRETYPLMRDARPNAGHRALVELERMGKLRAIVTQNIDGLHQAAGSSPDIVLELHGSNFGVRCLACGLLYHRDEVQRWLEAGVEVPTCPTCGGLLKVTTVSFGEPLPQDVLDEAQRLVRSCDLLLVMGTSLAVYPAAFLPVEAKRSGARLVIINLVPTAQDHLADAVLRGRTGELLPRLTAALRPPAAAAGSGGPAGAEAPGDPDGPGRARTVVGRLVRAAVEGVHFEVLAGDTTYVLLVSEDEVERLDLENLEGRSVRVRGELYEGLDIFMRGPVLRVLTVHPLPEGGEGGRRFR